MSADKCSMILIQTRDPATHGRIRGMKNCKAQGMRRGIVAQFSKCAWRDGAQAGSQPKRLAGARPQLAAGVPRRGRALHLRRERAAARMAVEQARSSSGSSARARKGVGAAQSAVDGVGLTIDVGGIVAREK